MNDVITFFDSLLKILFESFSSDAKECFNQFETQIIPFLNAEEKIDEIFETIFAEFPESNFKYQKIIEALISLASTDPVSILSNICNRFIKELNRTENQEPEILTIHLNLSNTPNFYFFHFIHHLNLKILTDLIKIFFIHFPNKQLIQKVVSCGYKLCTSSITDFKVHPDTFNSSNTSIFSRNFSIVKNNTRSNIHSRNKNNRLSKLEFQLIESWSIIFHHISKISMEVISFTLEQYSDFASSGHIFTLVSKVCADSSFIELLLDTVRNCQKYNQITSEMLSSLSSLFQIVKDISEDILVDFFTIAWSLKNHPNLKDQAIELICILFNRLPEFRTKSIQFYISKIYAHANDDRKVKRSAKAFLYQIRGDVSKLTIEGENPQFFNSSGTPTNNSFAVIFLKSFFEKSNFNVCIHLFGQILAHLASIDILTFERIIVPNFIKLDFLSPRFVSMAVALKIISSETFLKENFCKCSENQISIINDCFKQKIVDSFPQLIPYADDKYMIMTRKALKNLQKIESSDQVIIKFIINNSLQNYTPTSKAPKLAYVEDSAEKQISLQEESVIISENQNENDNKTANENQHQNKSSSNKFTNKFKLFNRIGKSKGKENEVKVENAQNKDQELNDINNNNNIETDKKDEELSLSSIAHLIRAASLITDLDVIKNSEIVIIVVRFMCHFNKDISNAANEVFSSFLKIEGAFEIIGNQIMSHLMTFNEEVSAHCLYLLYKMVKKITKNDQEVNTKNLNDFFQLIEAVAFCSLVYDSPYCRLTALNILKHLSLMNPGSIYNILRKKRSFLIDSFNESVFLMKTPNNPKSFKPVIGNVSIEDACCSRYNDLWIFYLSNAINTIMNSKHENKSSFIIQCSEIVHEIFSNKITNFTRTAASLIYINSFYYESNLQMRSSGNSKDSFSKKIVIDFDSDFDIKDSQKLKLANFGSILDLLNSNNTAQKKSLIHICSLLNHRIIERILPELLSVENDLYPSVSNTFIYLIRHSENFNGIISTIFPFLIKFLKLLQNYFTYLDINSTREIVWDDAHIKLLKPHQELSVNYCILTSMPFKNNMKLQLQIQEHNMPLIYRQVQLKFLLHWSQLPVDKNPELMKLKLYSLDTLILIINSGPVFIEGFKFDMNFFDVMTQCEMNGDPVLYSLLYYHVELLLGEFVKNCLMRSKDEFRFFLIPILSILSEFSETSLFERHIGSLLLLSIILKREKNKSYHQILTKLDELFIKKILFKNENERKKIKFSNLMKNFEFASEQIVESGLTILLECKSNINLFKSIVDAIHPIFSKIHFLPKQRLIFQEVPTKFQRFTTISFINMMFNVSISILSDEDKSDSFSLLWYNLLLSSDNTTIVLLLLFDHPHTEMKKRTFMSLMNKDPILITKFLSSKCTFAYWYFMQTQLEKKSIASITWIVPVLAHAFNYFYECITPYFITCLHFSFLFIEECKELFESLLASFRFEAVDSEYVWSCEGPRRIVQAAYIVSEIASNLAEENPGEVVNWTEEAVRWSVACNDIKVGYRSLYVLKVLQTDLSQTAFNLLAKAVKYHMSSIQFESDDYDDSTSKEREVSLFVGECFDIFANKMNNSDFLTFAFRFASLFLNCQFLDSACLKKAMPIFIACTSHMVLTSTAKKVLVDAFIPFIPDLELDIETQKLLGQIADRKSSPELFLVAAAFYRKRLPFVPLKVDSDDDAQKSVKFECAPQKVEDKPKQKIPRLVINQNSTSSDDDYNFDYNDIFEDDQITHNLKSCKDDYFGLADQILAIPFRVAHIHKALKIFSRLLYTASFELTDSVLDVCSILLDKYGDEIEINVLIPIFLFAIKNTSNMIGAKNFIQIIISVNPQIVRVIADKYSLPFTIIKSSIEDDDFYDYDYYYNSEDDREDVYFNDSLEINRTKVNQAERSSHHHLECENLVIYNLNINVNMNSNRFLTMTLNEGTIENRIKLIDDIKKGLEELDENPSEMIPITSCKQLAHLSGMIDQSNPPTISPFASHYDLVSKVLKENQEPIKRISSHNGALMQLRSVRFAAGTNNIYEINNSSNSNVITSPSSPILPSIRMKQSNFISTPISEKNLKLEQIPIRDIKLSSIQLNAPEITQFVINPKEFLNLVD